MIVEIEIEDIGYVRPLNAYQVARARRVKGPNNSIAWAAFSCGLSIRQFKGLSLEKQHQDPLRAQVHDQRSQHCHAWAAGAGQCRSASQARRAVEQGGVTRHHDIGGSARG